MSQPSSVYEAIYILINSNLDSAKRHDFILDAIDVEIQQLLKDETQLFHSNQSQLQYLLSKEKISKETYQLLMQLNQLNQTTDSEFLAKASLSVLLKLIHQNSGHEIPEDLRSYEQTPMSETTSKPTDDLLEFTSCRISIIKINEGGESLAFVFEKGNADIHSLNFKDLPEAKIKLLRQSLKILKLPFDIYVHQLQKLKGNWIPGDLIIVPDYLIDVTTIASCYNNRGSNPLKHLIHLYFYSPTAYSALLGNSVNQFLDELIINPALQFSDVSQNIFQHNPLAFSLLSDTEVLKFSESIQTHFENIRHIVSTRFDQLVPELENCLMEPSFYSIEYGIQGRLDVFYENKETLKKSIIELKSGKPYQSNEFGINPDHHAQITLYFLLIQSVFGSSNHLKSHILYSSQTHKPLRNAPVIEEIKHDLIQLRNSIILLHLHLAFRLPQDPFVLDLITDKHYQLTESYTKRDASLVLSIYSSLHPLEKDYFKELSGFVAREQFISKMGRSNSQYTEGLASLWLLTEHEKINNFMILHSLKIREIIMEPGEYPILILVQEGLADYLSNFRTGDTMILYSGKSVLKEQIYKCSLIEQFPNEYHVRLRSRQFPDPENSKLKIWNLEHDSMDRSFIHQYQGLLEFAQSSIEFRQKILGLQPPEKLDEISFKTLKLIPESIQGVIRKILHSKDYYLLWGPPGSGKTSLIIRYLTQVLITETNENILLLAYTNRAVDEMCEAIESIDLKESHEFIRIGSRFAVAPKFRKNLLEEKISSFKNRKQVLQLISNTRIFTATISSIQGKKELFLLKKFDTVIIDEASQILESQLNGLLHRFKRFILIGDHMQLPAVTAQTFEECSVYSENLRKAGFKSWGTSLFERLLDQNKSKSWLHAFEMLNYQGRMHEQLTRFPSKIFYENNLNILPDQLLKRQTQDYSKLFENISSPLHRKLSSHRTIFIHCENPAAGINMKTNVTEAILVSKLVSCLHNLYNTNLKPWTEYSLGIITPFRAQISAIKSQLFKDGLMDIPLSIDTAERYQGSTRDIIILCTIISEVKHLPQISSLNQDGIDRKLNVALTRAKEQIILIGNRHVLEASPIYKLLLQEYFIIDFENLILESEE